MIPGNPYRQNVQTHSERPVPWQAGETRKYFPALLVREGGRGGGPVHATIFPDSRVNRVFPIPIDTPSGPAGSVKIVDFTLFGQRFQAMSAGPLDPFNHAISMVVVCDDQAELDRYWAGLLQGGVEEQCGWLRDRYGVSWQIVLSVLDEMIADTKDVPA